MESNRADLNAERPAAPRETEGPRIILAAALGAFVEHGFHGTTVRDIAARANLSVAAIYYYFPSKLHILHTIMDVVIDDLIAELDEALRRAGNDPVAQLVGAVKVHVKVHTKRQAESFIGNSELRSLDPERRAAIIARRDAIGGLFLDVVRRGIIQGQFHSPWPKETTRAILTMCTAVASWYRQDGPNTPEEIAERYAQLALLMLQHDGPALTIHAEADPAAADQA